MKTSSFVSQNSPTAFANKNKCQNGKIYYHIHQKLDLIFIIGLKYFEINHSKFIKINLLIWKEVRKEVSKSEVKW